MHKFKLKRKRSKQKSFPGFPCGDVRIITINYWLLYDVYSQTFEVVNLVIVLPLMSIMKLILQEYCRTHGGYLATVDSSDEKDYINGMIQNDPGTKFLLEVNLWIYQPDRS